VYHLFTSLWNSLERKCCMEKSSISCHHLSLTFYFEILIQKWLLKIHTIESYSCASLSLPLGNSFQLLINVRLHSRFQAVGLPQTSLFPFSAAERCLAVSQVEAAEANRAHFCCEVLHLLSVNNSRTSHLPSKDRNLATSVPDTGKDFVANLLKQLITTKH